MDCSQRWRTSSAALARFSGVTEAFTCWMARVFAFRARFFIWVRAFSAAVMVLLPNKRLSWYEEIWVRLLLSPRAVTRFTGLSEMVDICFPEEIWLLIRFISEVILLRLVRIL